MTRTGSPSSAIANTAAETAAAPAMSHFIVIMPLPVLIDRPPESKVMPLPTRAMCALARAGRYVSLASRGCRVEPLPTPSRPP